MNLPRYTTAYSRLWHLYHDMVWMWLFRLSVTKHCTRSDTCYANTPILWNLPIHTKPKTSCVTISFINYRKFSNKFKQLHIQIYYQNFANHQQQLYPVAHLHSLKTSITNINMQMISICVCRRRCRLCCRHRRLWRFCCCFPFCFD